MHCPAGILSLSRGVRLEKSASTPANMSFTGCYLTGGLHLGHQCGVVVREQKDSPPQWLCVKVGSFFESHAASCRAAAGPPLLLRVCVPRQEPVGRAEHRGAVFKRVPAEGPAVLCEYSPD